MSLVHLFGLARTAVRTLRVAADSNPSGDYHRAARSEAAKALHVFGLAQQASEPETEIPDLPGWGEDREPAPERIAEHIAAGEGTREQIAAYADALETWSCYGVPPERRIFLAMHRAWTHFHVYVHPPGDLRSLQNMAPFRPAHFRMNVKTALAFLDHVSTVDFAQKMGDVSALERRSPEFRFAGLGDFVVTGVQPIGINGVHVADVPDGTVLYVALDGTVLAALFGAIDAEGA